MTGKRLTDFQPAPWREYAIKAELRGKEITDNFLSDPASVILLGAIDMIRELTERIEKLEKLKEESKG